MKWTLCFLVRDLATRQIVFHEIQEVEAPAAERAKMTNQRISELSMKYPLTTHDVSMRGFDSLQALYSTLPELAPKVLKP